MRNGSKKSHMDTRKICLILCTVVGLAISIAFVVMKRMPLMAISIGIVLGVLGKGVVPYIKRRQRCLATSVLAAGVIFVIGGVFFEWGQYLMDELLYSNLCALIKRCMGVFVFIYAGGCVFFTALSKSIMKKLRCTEKVTAVCYRIIEEMHREKSSTGKIYKESMTYCPVFEYRYKEKIYNGELQEFEYYRTAELNEEYILYINPRDPVEYYREGVGNGSVALAIFGLVFAAIPIVMVLAEAQKILK